MTANVPIRLVSALVIPLATLIAAPAQTISPRHTARYTGLPLRFEPNRGQSDPAVQYLSHGGNYTVLLEPSAATLVLHRDAAQAKAASPAKPGTGEAVRMTLEGTDPRAVMSPDRPLPGYVSYMTGSDRSQWKLGIPTYAATRVSQPYPGIDLVYYGTERQLEYDFIVAPHADPSLIQLSLAGADPVLEPTGELRLQIAAEPRDSDILFRKPVLYQQVNGARRPVDGSFTLAANGQVGFHVGSYDHARELIIDPIISYASYFGGSGEDEINGSALNASNQLYAAGQTFSTALPDTTGEFQTGSVPGNNGHDAFVTKFSADGSAVLWTTYLSGALDDFATSVAVNANDQAYVVGYTSSCGSNGTSLNTPGEFPFTTDAVQALCNPSVNGFNNYESNGGGYDVFLVKLSSDGKTELYGTPLGGTNNDIAQSVAVDASGKVYIVGETVSSGYHYAVEFKNDSDTPSYPVNNHGQPSIGTANYPTTANAFYTNTTESKKYATTSPDGTMNGPTDEQAFLTVLSADLHSLVYSSLIGGGVIGGCGNGACNTNGLALAVSSTGIAYIGGNTSSAHWPTTTGAFAPTCSNAGAANSQCPMTGWIAAFDPTKSGAASLVFSSYVNGSSGGTNGDATPIYPGSDVFGLATDSTGNVVLTGDTGANNFPVTTGVLQPTCAPGTGGGGQINQCSAAYVMKLSPAGSILWSTYYGSPTATSAGAYLAGSGVALDASDNVYIVGNGNETPIVKNAIVAAPQGTDIFILELAPDASSLTMGTWLGATGGVSLNNNSLHLDSGLNAYFSGYQCPNPYGGTGFPLSANAFDKTIQGCDGFVVKLATQTLASTTALRITPNAGAPGTSISFTATVTGQSGVATPTGTVALTSGTTALGTITLTNGTGTFTTTTLASGTYSVIATYSGDSAYSASATTAQSVAIQSTPTVALTATPTTATVGMAIALTATVTATTGTPTGTVYFMDGTTILGSSVLANGSASYAATSLAVGTHALSARYGGDSNFTTLTSSAQTVTITAIPSTLTVAAAPAALVIKSGSFGTTVITATPANGFAGTLTLSCGTLPTFAGCSFSSKTLTFVTTGGAAQISTLTITTNGTASAQLKRPARTQAGTFATAFAALLILPLAFTRQARKLLHARSPLTLSLLVLLSLAATALTGCGGSNTTSPVPPATTTPVGTYTVAVSVAGAPTATALNLQVTIQ